MFEAYSVGIRIRLVENVAAGVMGMAGQFGILNRHVEASKAQLTAFENQLKRIRSIGLIGGAAAAVGGFGLSLFKAPIEEAARFDQQVQRFKLFGLGDAVTAEATKFAKGMNIIGTSYTDAMRHMNEAQGVFREAGLAGSAALSGAKLAAPLLSKIDFATEALDDETKSRMRTSSLAMLRFIELRGGLQNPATFNSIADAGWKAIQTSGGNVNWEQLRQFMARGGVSAQGLSNTALFGKLEPIIGEMKGSSAGTALMTAYNRLVGAVRLPNQVAHMLADNGIWDASKIQWNAMGGIKSFRGNPLKDMALFSQDPTQFYDRDIMPLYERMKLSHEERARDNILIFGRTGGLLFNLYDRQREVAQRSVAAQAKALGIDSAVDAASQTMQGRMVDLTSKWKNLLVELGDNVLPVANKGLEKLTGLLTGINDFTNKFPTLTNGVMLFGASLFGLVAVGGTLTLATAGFKALGLALEMQGIGAAASGAGGVGGLLLSVAGGLTGPGGLIVGLLALGATVAGLSWIADKFKQQHQSDPGDHAKQHWISGGGRSGAGGYWEDNVQSLGRGLGYNLWSNGKWIHSSSMPDGSGSSPYLAQARAPETVVKTQINLDGRKVAESTTRHQARAANGPQTGTSSFDERMSMAPAGGVGVD